MNESPLTGAQKTRLRGLGQRLDAAIKIGRAGFARDQAVEFARLLDARELVKVRFEGSDRHERAELITRIEQEVGAPCVGSVGHTALFFRRQADPARRVIEL